LVDLEEKKRKGKKARKMPGKEKKEQQKINRTIPSTPASLAFPLPSTITGVSIS
jgi:hypothetical protein